MEFFHVLNRGVEKRNVVLDDSDRLRFIHDLYAFNDVSPALNYILPGRFEETRRELLVDIHAFCLMDNHYHLLLSERVENGISLFMKKLNMGYAKYFNERYERSGALWQGKYKKISVKRDAHFLYISYYIHLNPLDFYFPEWRSGKVGKVSDALGFLEKYRWSSYLDYMGRRNFPSITRRDQFPQLHSKEIRTIIQGEELEHLSHTLE
jgi:putative transposase